MSGDEKTNDNAKHDMLVHAVSYTADHDCHMKPLEAGETYKDKNVHKNMVLSYLGSLTLRTFIRSTCSHHVMSCHVKVVGWRLFGGCQVLQHGSMVRFYE